MKKVCQLIEGSADSDRVVSSRVCNMALAAPVLGPAMTSVRVGCHGSVVAAAPQRTAQPTDAFAKSVMAAVANCGAVSTRKMRKVSFCRAHSGRGVRSGDLPPAPSDLTQIEWEDYAGHLMLAVTLTCACAILSFVLASPLLAALAGALAVPIVVFQHDVRHLHHTGASFEENLSDVLVLITGTCYGILPWSGVHVKHHAFTGSYQGAVLAQSLRHGTPAGSVNVGDLDDLAGPLRHGNPFEPARHNPILRAMAALCCMLLTLSLFQGMFMLQSLVGPLQSAKCSAHDREVVWKGAALTAMHLALGLCLLGPVGFAMYSIGMSACLTLLTAPVHDARGVPPSSVGYCAQQVAATANIAEHENPFIRYFMMGMKKQQLAACAKSYCESQGLEYREVKLVEAWQSWAAEAYRLAGRPYQPAADFGTRAV